MNLAEVKKLLQLMEEHGLAEIELEREGGKIRLRKQGAGGEPIIERVAAPQAAAPAPAASEAEPATPKGKEITSPMVGTFYRAPSPESPPFVEVGQVIDVGQVICIIEAMKLMNELKSEVKGRVVQILPDNGQPIEFGQPLFVVEPA